MTRQKAIRAAIGRSPANYNITIPPQVARADRLDAIDRMSDRTCPWVHDGGKTEGAKFIAMEHGKDNGCTVPNPIPTWQSGGMLCVDFAGCRAGYPTRICTFNGGHGTAPGASNWMWEFIKQF